MMWILSNAVSFPLPSGNLGSMDRMMPSGKDPPV
jgi:hypothetical protein